jgi:multidrug efflux pump subunit AcrA (membrane-fusion protein)
LNITKAPEAQKTQAGPPTRIGPILIGPILIVALFLSACAGRPAETSIPPTPFPTLPLAPAPTATPYVFRPGGAPAVTALPTPALAQSEQGAIPVDVELVGLDPPLPVTFPQGVSGQLIALYVRLGQQVAAGDWIATVQDDELQRAVHAAQLALEQAKAARAEGEAAAEAAYQRALQSARWDLDRAWTAVQIAEKQASTTAVARAQAALAGALTAEAEAADAHKQALDRPWEPSEVRDALYRAWQTTIVNRELAELDLADARVAVEVHGMQLAALRQEVSRARSRVDGLAPEVDPALARAESAALQALAGAQERLSLTELYAPRGGRVVAVGAAVGAAVDGGTAIVTLLDAGELRFVTLNLEERHAALLRPGQPAQIVLRAYPEALFPAEVDMVLPPAGAQSAAQRAGPGFVAYLRVTDTAGLDLLPGMTGRAEIALGNE